MRGLRSPAYLFDKLEDIIWGLQSMSESSDIHITVTKREETGKAEVGRLRRTGRIPAVVYGGGKPPVSISVEDDAVQRILKSEGGDNTIFLLKLEDGKEERRAMIKEMQQDPMTGKFLHLDFIRVLKGHKLNVTVRLEVFGDSVGVREGGRMDFITRELAVEVLPRDMFDKIEIDISELEIGQQVTVADLEEHLPKSGKFMDDGQRVVVVIGVPRSVEEEEVEEDAAADLLMAEQAEPELIGKTKDGEEAD